MSSPETNPPQAPFEPLAQYGLDRLCSLGIGGPAEYFSAPQSVPQLLQALCWAKERKLAITVLGGGSNVVIHDGGVAGLVLRPAFGEQHVQHHITSVTARIGSGISWDCWVADCVARGWSGIECLSGIPGNVGATPIQNVGAYGQEVSQSIESVEAYDLQAEEVLSLSAAQCQFGYRTSLFKSLPTPRYIVLNVTFRLQLGAPQPVRYGELSRTLQDTRNGAIPSLSDIREAVLTIRRRKSMVLDPGDPNTRSCGSFFLNPVVAQDCLDAIARATSEQPPHFAQPAQEEGEASQYKIPAAWLIERAGICKGQRFGNVGISSKHTLALICHAGATAQDVVSAARTVRDTVRDKLGVTLKPEPRFIGFEMGNDGLPLSI